MNLFKEHFPGHNMIDITIGLKDATYRSYQLANIQSPVIMFAQKTEQNNSVFASRVDSPLSDIMVLYHGSFRTFQYSTLENVFSSVCNMIK